MSHFQFRSHQA